MWIERKDGREKWRVAARGSLLRLVRQKREKIRKGMEIAARINQIVSQDTSKLPGADRSDEGRWWL
jgi:hypothetical protein